MSTWDDVCPSDFQGIWPSKDPLLPGWGRAEAAQRPGTEQEASEDDAPPQSLWAASKDHVEGDFL